MSNRYEPPGVDLAHPHDTSTDAEKSVTDQANKAVAFAVGGLVCCAPLSLVAISKGRDLVKAIDSAQVGLRARSTASCLPVATVGQHGVAPRRSTRSVAISWRSAHDRRATGRGNPVGRGWWTPSTREAHQS